MNITEARALVIGANPALDLAQVEEAAQKLVQLDAIETAKAEYQAAAEEQQRADDARRAAQRDLFSSAGDSGGPSSKELEQQLRDLVERGEGWA
jgi:hypothetical protein